MIAFTYEDRDKDLEVMGDENNVLTTHNKSSFKTNFSVSLLVKMKQKGNS